MFIGFDYGTANCSVAVMRENTPQLLTLENGSALLPSMLCAPTREAVSEWLYRHHDVPTHSDENQALLRRAIAANRDEDIEVLRNSSSVSPRCISMLKIRKRSTSLNRQNPSSAPAG